jgi:Uma2 family endonuclease
MVQIPSQRPDSRSIDSRLSTGPTDLDWDRLSEEWESDEPELESDFHRDQIDSLLRLMKWIWRDRTDLYCSGNTTVYYDEDQRTNRNFRGPDIYVVLGADPRSRRSWMTWREGGLFPNVVIELLSPGTAKVDRTTKKTLYQDVWKLPNYFWFHPDTKEFKGFRLINGQYQALVPNSAGQLWCEELQLFLGLHNGYLWLFTPTGQVLLAEEQEQRQRAELEAKRAELESQRAEAESQRAEAESQRADRVTDELQAERDRANVERDRADRLAAKLRELGINL